MRFCNMQSKQNWFQLPLDFASNAAITRGEYFYYLVQALAATEEPDICTLDPNLCPTPRCGNGKKNEVKNVMMGTQTIQIAVLIYVK